jgi:hypothetical protein
MPSTICCLERGVCRPGVYSDMMTIKWRHCGGSNRIIIEHGITTSADLSDLPFNQVGWITQHKISSLQACNDRWTIPDIAYRKECINSKEALSWGYRWLGLLTVIFDQNISAPSCGLPFKRGGLSRNFVKLALHNIKLSPEYYSRAYPNKYESESENPDPSRPAGHHPFVDQMLRGVFLSATAAAAVFVAFKSAEYADDHGSRLWWLPFLGFLALAFWLADHAVAIGLPA